MKSSLLQGVVLASHARARLPAVLAAAFLAVAWQGSRAGGADLVPVFSRRCLEPGEDARWKPAEASGLRLSPHYIAGPGPGQDREAWLRRLLAYRKGVREGKLDEVLDLDFRGVRAWVRLSVPLAKACRLKPGDAVRIQAEARWIQGNSDLCVAFDLHGREDDRKLGWSTVQATLGIPRDGKWHSLDGTIRVPEFDRKEAWLRPILGLDATKDPTPGHLEIRGLRLGLDDPERMDALKAFVEALPPPGLNLAIYDRKEMAWAASIFTCHFTFMYDRSFYDPEEGRYRLEEFLEDGRREFGGYDAILLWQGYPRLGVDPRNQFDIYRDMPGGIEGLRGLARRARELGTRVFIDYNPWDRGTRREGRRDEEVLAEIVAAMDVDGIFLDTMSAGSDLLRKAVDAARPGVVFAPEGHPEISQLGICSASWAQGLHDPAPPGILHLKWIEPRHMQHQIWRWDSSHDAEIESAFLNGSGMLVWENIFGTYNPWSGGSRALWKRASAVLRSFPENLKSDAWDPFYPTLNRNLFACRWPGEDSTLFTLLNVGDPIDVSPLLEVPREPDAVFLDVWSGGQARTEVRGDRVLISGSVGKLGALAVFKPGKPVKLSQNLFPLHDRAERPPRLEERGVARSVVDPRPVERTEPASGEKPPAGMVLVPGARIRVKIEHMRRECGCYPDPGTPPERWKDFLWGSPHDGTIRHDFGPVEVKPFLIDEAEVSNADFQSFLEASGYRPEHRENFLAHRPPGKMTAEIAEEPVVYVDLDDARAYARWAGKRLPTEIEWHLAAQGTDGRKWPWGGEFDGARCNTVGKPLPVRSLPEGRSPYGCYHMSGNVWEWTESARDDGHTRFAILRGGSYFDAQGSIWYIRGGPQPCNHHAKLILMWPGLDRCATVGFRCVKDVQ